MSYIRQLRSTVIFQCGSDDLMRQFDWLIIRPGVTYQQKLQGIIGLWIGQMLQP
jgi:hypothetical protein